MRQLYENEVRSRSKIGLQVSGFKLDMLVPPFTKPLKVHELTSFAFALFRAQSLSFWQIASLESKIEEKNSQLEEVSRNVVDAT